MGAVTIALIGFFVFLIMRVTTPQMTPLFTDLAYEDSAAIVKELDRQAVPYELRNDGNIVLVPKDRVARLRMSFAEGGLPKGGGVGYEIFDKSEVLGTTSFVQNINNVRALEGELARTIRSLDRVQDARVHLVMPDRPLFARDKVDATASIVLKVRGTLEQHQVRAIRHLVAGAVNGLRPERVSVVDERGQLLADGASNDPNGGDVSTDERQAAFEKRLRSQVEAIVSSVVGPNHARGQGAADFDFNRVTQTSDKYDPQGPVVRPSQTREETSATNDGKENQVTVGNEIPGGQRQAAPGADNPAARDESRKSEEIVNYEISKTTKTEVPEGGSPNRISGAVLVDGTYGKNHKGESTYQPRSKEELDQIAALVRSAIGFNQKRGDQVEIVNLKFADAPASAPIAEPTGIFGMLQFTKDDVMYVIELGVMMLLGLVVMFMVIRPLVKRILASEEIAAALNGEPAAALADGSAQAGTPGQALLPGTNSTAQLIDVAQVQGQVHAQSVHRVGELAERNPNETAAIIRQWLSDP